MTPRRRRMPRIGNDTARPVESVKTRPDVAITQRKEGGLIVVNNAYDVGKPWISLIDAHSETSQGCLMSVY